MESLITFVVGGDDDAIAAAERVEAVYKRSLEGVSAAAAKANTALATSFTNVAAKMEFSGSGGMSGFAESMNRALFQTMSVSDKAGVRITNLGTQLRALQTPTEVASAGMGKFSSAVTGGAGALAGMGVQGASAVGQIASLFASGNPLMVGIGLAAIAIGFIAKGWREYEEAEKRATEYAAGAGARRLKIIEDETAAVKKRTTAFSEADKEDAIARITAAKAIIEAEEGAIKRLDRTYATKKKLAATEDSFRRHSLLLYDAQTALSAAESRLDAASAAHIERMKEEFMFSKINAETLREQSKETDRLALAKKHKAEQDAYYFGQLKAGNDLDAALLKKQTDDEENAAVERIMRERRLEQAAVERVVAEAEAQSAADKKLTEQLDESFDRAVEREEQLKNATKERDQAQRDAAASAVMSASVNTTYAVSMDVVSSSTGFATQQLQKFGDINRDNYSDILDFSPKARDALVKEAQGAIFNMGLQAGTKAIFEQGEAFKETALAAGSFALHEYDAGAMHLVSAATHQVASASYATIGGGAVGASFGIGAMRGKGGMFGTGNDSTDSTGGGSASSRDSGSGGSGPSAGRGGSGGGTPVVNYTIVMGPGTLMNPGDDRQTRRIVATAHQRNSRDRFAQLRNLP